MKPDKWERDRVLADSGLITYNTFICQGCKKQWAEMSVDGRCSDCGDKIIVCPF
jgi:hypothetical protein